MLADLPVAHGQFAPAVGHDGRLYLFGGYGNGIDWRAVEAYDPRTRTWTCSTDEPWKACTSTSLTPMPTRRAGQVAATGTDGTIYLFGGQSLDFPSETTVEAYNPTSNSWTCSTGDPGSTCTSTLIPPVPTGSPFDAATVPDGRIFLQTSLSSSPIAYDPHLNTWICPTDIHQVSCSSSTLAPQPSGASRTGRMIAGSDGKLYVIGGQHCTDYGCTPVMEAYDPATNSWSCSVGDTASGCTSTTLSLAPVALPAQVRLVTGSDGLIYAVLPADPTSGHAQIEAYDPKANVWDASLPPAPSGLGATASPGPDDGLYMLGGSPVGSTTASVRVEAYDRQLAPPTPTPAPTATPQPQSFHIVGLRVEAPAAKPDWQLRRPVITRIVAGQPITLALYVKFDLIPNGSSFRALTDIYKNGVQVDEAGETEMLRSTDTGTDYIHYTYTISTPGKYRFVATATLNNQTARTTTEVTATQATGSVAYIQGWSVHIRPVNGAPARAIALPWKVSGLAWSPNAKKLVVNDWYGRLAVVDVPSGAVHVVQGSPQPSTSLVARQPWSSDSRYLSFYRTGHGGGQDLWMWDDVTRTEWVAVHGMAQANPVAWAHVSDRYVVATGPFRVMPKVVNPTLEVRGVRGQRYAVLGHGDDASWSPDDRYVAYSAATVCGASQCIVDQYLVPSSGGRATNLSRGVSDVLAGDEWSARPQGFNFDRWVLDPRGHVVRRVAGYSNAESGETVDAWSPNGTWAIIQSLDEYNYTPLSLTLVSVAGNRTFVYATVPLDPCGACTRQYFDVSWDAAGDMFAFAVPPLSSKQGTEISSKAYVYTLNPESRVTALKQLQLPAAHAISVAGFTSDGGSVLIRLDGALDRYDLTTDHIVQLAASIPTAPYTEVLPTVSVAHQPSCSQRFLYCP